MKKLTPVAAVLSKLLEVAHWVGAVTFAALLIVSLLSGNLLPGMITTEDPVADGAIEAYGFGLTVFNTDGSINVAAIRIFAAGAAIIFALMAMIFRNVYLSLKTSQGQTKFSEGATPFQQPIVRMIREIGIFSISVPVVGLIFSGIAMLVLGHENAEISVNFSLMAIGVMMLCLSQVFDEGTGMRQDVDGLL